MYHNYKLKNIMSNLFKINWSLESLDQYSDYLEKGGVRMHTDGEPVMSDGELLDLIIEVTKTQPNAEGLPTDRDILMSINNALYNHFNEETLSINN
jgi:hypothetical protein